MPISQYDRLFGGKGSAQKTLDSMKRTYGPKKGETVFYATVAKRERKHAKRSRAARWLHSS
jgi:hypothetical protein